MAIEKMPSLNASIRRVSRSCCICQTGSVPCTHVGAYNSREAGPAIGAFAFSGASIKEGRFQTGPHGRVLRASFVIGGLQAYPPAENIRNAVSKHASSCTSPSMSTKPRWACAFGWRGARRRTRSDIRGRLHEGIGEQARAGGAGALTLLQQSFARRKCPILSTWAVVANLRFCTSARLRRTDYSCRHFLFEQRALPLHAPAIA